MYLQRAPSSEILHVTSKSRHLLSVNKEHVGGHSSCFKDCFEKATASVLIVYDITLPLFCISILFLSRGIQTPISLLWFLLTNLNPFPSRADTTITKSFSQDADHPLCHGYVDFFGFSLVALFLVVESCICVLP